MQHLVQLDEAMRVKTSLGQPRFESLQVFRGLAAMWVLWFHAGVVSRHKFGVEFVGNLFHSGHLGVSFFFVLSGFIISYVHRKDIGRPETSRRFILKRFWRIYPLSLLITACYLPLLATFSATAFSLSQTISSFFLLPQNGFPIVTVAWTLAHEVFFYAVFLLIIILGWRIGVCLLIGWALGIFLLQQSGAPTLDWLLNFIFNPYNLQFLGGCLIADLFARQRISTRIACSLTSVGLGLLIGGCFYYDWIEARTPLAERSYWALCFGTLVLGSVCLENYWNLRFPAVLLLLGDASYSIYLVHLNVLSILAIMCNTYSIRSYINVQCLVTILGLVALACGVALWRFLESPLSNFTKRFVATKQEMLPVAHIT